jgi:hypothetical protein
VEHFLIDLLYFSECFHRTKTLQTSSLLLST